ncbi:MAG TPA: methyltransferase domain-containing protein [Rudaea sp.]|nr:methyltransferase domain-containing protein [Rudaea sp.]
MTQSGNIDPATAQLIALETDIKEGRIDAAIARLKAFVAAYPADVRAHFFDALIARARNDTRNELLAFKRVTTLAPRWAPPFAELAMSLLREGRHAEAMTAADTAVELAPDKRPMLDVAIAVAVKTGFSTVALAYMRRTHALWPADLVLDRKIGTLLTILQRYDEAEAHWRKLLAQNPDDTQAEVDYGYTLTAMGRNDDAVVLLERVLRREPGNATAAFFLAAARGETPASQPAELVQAIFDGYAERFDKQLVGKLKYRVPQRVAEIIRARGHDRFDLLDLGCGTGLLGVHLGKPNGSWVGVDLSPRMLEQARRHGLYAELKQGDLLDILRETAPSSFDIVTANDVFIYVGDLAAVIPACFEVLRPGGTLIFSCEAADAAEGAFVLRPSKRYAHSRASIEALCLAAGFARCTIEAIDVRLENDVPIPGFIVVAEKT